MHYTTEWLPSVLFTKSDCGKPGQREGVWRQTQGFIIKNSVLFLQMPPKMRIVPNGNDIF